jgi:hypothetical protein
MHRFNLVNGAGNFDYRRRHGNEPIAVHPDREPPLPFPYRVTP